MKNFAIFQHVTEISGNNLKTVSIFQHETVPLTYSKSNTSVSFLTLINLNDFSKVESVTLVAATKIVKNIVTAVIFNIFVQNPKFN